MFSRIGQLIFDNEAVAQTSDFTMGLEIEMQRIDEEGNFSKEPYPAGIGDEKTNPWITTDYLEVMTEVVTPSAEHAIDAMHYLYGINTALRVALAPGEMLWPLSMPPALPADKSPENLAKENLVFAKAGPAKEAYLVEWAKRRGWSQGTPCGVHINLSISEHIIKLVLQNFPERFRNETEVRNHLYTVVAQGFVRYRWFITYLFGASPVAEANYFEKDKELPHAVRSLRQSSQGFGTKFSGDYSSVKAYVARIEAGAKDGTLISDYEFHGPVRLKGGKNLQDLKKNGIDYIELRMLDLDPSSSVGVRTSTLRFIRLLASYFIMNPAIKEDEVNAIMSRADEMNNEVALEAPTQPTRYQNKALAFLQTLAAYANRIQLGPEYQELLDDLEDRIENPRTTPAAKLMNYVEDGSLRKYAVRKARHYQNAALQTISPFQGFEREEPLTATELRQGLFKGNW
ncbi:glutamate--cysteine ligase [Ligilactobacillus equi]|nr:glutamate--cysteine ligase [Ligilactobacillus equi]MCQ2557358.1 glutamate--cysteine ligase [Ligilactobacillus sp.]